MRQWMKMATLSILGQNVKKKSPKQKVQRPWVLVCSIADVGSTMYVCLVIIS